MVSIDDRCEGLDQISLYIGIEGVFWEMRKYLVDVVCSQFRKNNI